jgi:hypothetical protein
MESATASLQTLWPIITIEEFKPPTQSGFNMGTTS